MATKRVWDMETKKFYTVDVETGEIVEPEKKEKVSWKRKLAEKLIESDIKHEAAKADAESKDNSKWKKALKIGGGLAAAAAVGGVAYALGKGGSDQLDQQPLPDFGDDESGSDNENYDSKTNDFESSGETEE